METLVISYTDGDYKFKIKGKDYQEVLDKLCDFLNGELDFPYTFSLNKKEEVV